MTVREPMAVNLRMLCVVLITAITACGGEGVTPPPTVLSLEGTVRNANTNSPLPGAVVITGGYSGDVYTSRRISGTDAQGHYSIDDLCSGSDYLEAQAPGFVRVVGPVACAPGRQTIDIALTPVFHP